MPVATKNLSGNRVAIIKPTIILLVCFTEMFNKVNSFDGYNPIKSK